MVGEMAMKSPRSWVVGVKSNDNAFFGRYEYRVANSAGYAHIIYFNNLESVSMKVHGMWHHGAICEYKLNPFVFNNRKWRGVLGPYNIVDRPYITCHVASKIKRIGPISFAC